VSVKRYIDEIIGRGELQKSGRVEESLDLPILAVCDDSVSRDRLEWTDERQIQVKSSKSQLTFTVIGLFVDLRANAPKLYADKSSTCRTNLGTSIANEGTC
jgi:hypothetical protein